MLQIYAFHYALPYLDAKVKPSELTNTQELNRELNNSLEGQTLLDQFQSGFVRY